MKEARKEKQSQEIKAAAAGRDPEPGRKKGSIGQRPRLIAEAALANSDAPLNVLLSVMRKAYADCELSLALDADKAAAPFCHPRLTGSSSKRGRGGRHN